MTPLLTDLYELTMAAGYFAAGIHDETAAFDLSVRRLPVGRSYMVLAGLAQAVQFLLEARFSPAEIEYLRKLQQFSAAPESFFEALRSYRFTGDAWAVREGTVVFAEEPLMTVRGPLWQAQLAETYLLATIGFQTLIATKAARVTAVAAGRGVVEFGTRRAHSPEAGVLASRAAYIGGCIGTSNTLTGFLYGVPVYGTAAHSWIEAFSSELVAHRTLQKLLGDGTIYLIDTYDTLEGARKAASLGRPLWGVRLDSGDLIALSREVRKILDEAGLPEAKIMATSDLNEFRIRQIVEAGAPIDAFGVGTDLATSSDAPNISAVYKLVELEEHGATRYTAKFSTDKVTFPGMKQVFRMQDRDVIARVGERLDGEPLLEQVIRRGELVSPLPDVHAARAHAAASLKRLPEEYRRLDGARPYTVEHSDELKRLLESARQSALNPAEKTTV